MNRNSTHSPRSFKLPNRSHSSITHPPQFADLSKHLSFRPKPERSPLNPLSFRSKPERSPLNPFSFRSKPERTPPKTLSFRPEPERQTTKNFVIPTGAGANATA